MSDIAAITSEVRDFVRMMVRAGYDDVQEIVPNTVDYFTGTHDEELVGEVAERVLPEEIQALQSEQASWPTITDYDRLVRTFNALERRGIVARENFTCCQNCGMAEIGAELDAEENAGISVRGFTFFHVQDTERAVQEGELFLSFGGVEDTEAAALATAGAIVNALREEGLEVDWNGSWGKRIHVKMNWQRRFAGAA